MHVVVTGGARFLGDLDPALQLASVAPPIGNLEVSIATPNVGSVGTWRAPGLAKERDARFGLGSESGTHGYSHVHSNTEDYAGHSVDPQGVCGEVGTSPDSRTLSTVFEIFTDDRHHLSKAGA